MSQADTRASELFILTPEHRKQPVSRLISSRVSLLTDTLIHVRCCRIHHTHSKSAAEGVKSVLRAKLEERSSQFFLSLFFSEGIFCLTVPPLCDSDLMFSNFSSLHHQVVFRRGTFWSFTSWVVCRWFNGSPFPSLSFLWSLLPSLTYWIKSRALQQSSQCSCQSETPPLRMNTTGKKPQWFNSSFRTKLQDLVCNRHKHSAGRRGKNFISFRETEASWGSSPLMFINLHDNQRQKTESSCF